MANRDIPDTITIGVYHSIDDDGNIIFDVDEMTDEFNKMINDLIDAHTTNEDN
jgi:hypothetical protein